MVITDLAREPDAAAVRELLPVPPRILALGEPTHGRDVLLELRNDLFEGLIEGGDHPTIALESDAIRGLLVDDYITGAGGSLDDVMTHGFSHGFGESAANRELVRRLREFNSTREPGAQVRFAGFDGPLEMEAAASPRQAIHALRDVVTSVVGEEIGGARDEVDELIGEDDRWTDPRIMYDPARSIGRTPEAARLRVLVDDLVALLDANMPALVSHSNGSWYRARMHAIAAVGLLRYHHAMADPSAHRMGALLGQRAAIMAANLLMLAERGPVLAFAHNAHLQRPPSSMTMGDRPVRWWSAGAILSARLGDNYRFLARSGRSRPRGWLARRRPRWKGGWTPSAVRGCCSTPVCWQALSRAARRRPGSRSGSDMHHSTRSTSAISTGSSTCATPEGRSFVPGRHTGHPAVPRDPTPEPTRRGTSL